ncbi:hypothetical protein APHAL10511_008029 [Amanita phalloides]|nr:hypothetical protein APHAL10511_008029 [Amanita phalloides]
MSRYRVRAALNDDKHIILFSVYEKDSITRGLVVKVMTDISPSDDDISSRYDIFGGYDIRCRYIGPVYFAPEPMGSLSIPLYSVLISDCGADLDTGVSAGDHIKTKERKKERKT